MINSFKKFAFLLGPRQTKIAAGLFVMMLFGAGFEALGIGLIMPFMAILSEPESVDRYETLVWVRDAFGFNSPDELLLASGLALLAAYFIKNAYLAGMYYVQYGFVYSNLVRLTVRLLDAYLGSPYIFHVQRNSSDLVRNLTTEVSTVFNRVLLPFLTFAIELSVMIGLAALLLVVEPVVTLVAVGVLGSISVAFYVFVRRKVLTLGQIQQYNAALIIRWVNQGVGGIKESKVLGREAYFVDAFEESSAAYADSIRAVKVVQMAPRFVIETLGIGGMLTVLVLMMAQGESLSRVLPVLGLFGLAAVRLMPSLTRLISAMTSIRNGQVALDLIYDDLRNLEGREPPSSEAEHIDFQKSIRLEEVSYQYPESDGPVIENLCLTIPRGTSVAFVGPSGSGKTTTVDLILGLLEPQAGRVTVDDQDIAAHMPGWQRKIGYISQPTYLMDESVRRNVAFGVPDVEVSDQQVWDALDAAQLRDHVESLPEGIDTIVGEDGRRFSGGQRQRLGIARALYHNPEVLVLDEATSALDNKTEKEITSTIARLRGSRTILTIAHRLSTIRDCDLIYFLADGVLRGTGTYDELVENNAAFKSMVNARKETPMQISGSG